MPPRYGHWRTIYGRHRRWSADGTYRHLLEALTAGSDRDGAALTAAGEYALSVDSTVVRAHADAAGARDLPPADVDLALLAELAALAAPCPTRGEGTSGGQRPPAAAEGGFQQRAAAA